MNHANETLLSLVDKSSLKLCYADSTIGLLESHFESDTECYLSSDEIFNTLALVRSLISEAKEIVDAIPAQTRKPEAVSAS